ncbi:MAG: hypothetical protein ABIZ70_05805, partial [Gemmatimonadales bacterium]
MPRISSTMLMVAVLVACRGEPPAAAQSLNQQQLTALVDSLMPGVAKATGLAFKSTPAAVVRSREEVRSYLLAKLQQELPPARIEGITAAYRLLGLLPDTLDVSKLFIDLYTEQVAGFYDPDSTKLFAVVGGDRAQLRLVLAHELVHALQHQYTPLDSILKDIHDADRLAAAQAVFEGQATLASMVTLVPGMDLVNNDEFWETFRSQLQTQQVGMKVFNAAPLVIRSGLTFPYLQGSEFLRWFRRNHADQQPFGDKLPVSTEQILHPDRYAKGDLPMMVRFAADTAQPIYEDTFGEFEIAVLRSSLAGISEVPTDLAVGWGGDRLRVYRSAGGPALVWVTVFDEPRNAERFLTLTGNKLAAQKRAGYRTTAEGLQVGGKSAVRVVVAPEGWARWSNLPTVEL